MSFVSRHFIDKYDLEMKKSDMLLQLADGNTAILRGTCDVPLQCNKYNAELRLMSLRMNPCDTLVCIA